MLITPWLRSMKSVLGPHARKPSKAASRRRNRAGCPSVVDLALQVERLEDRTLLSSVSAAELVNGRVMITGDTTDDHLEVDVRFDAAGVDGAGIYLFIQDLGPDGTAGTADDGTVTAVGPNVNQVDSDGDSKFDEVTIFIPNVTRGIRAELGDGNDQITFEDTSAAAITDKTGGASMNGGARYPSAVFFNATILGGNGNDQIIAGLGNDRLEGNDGRDTLVGGIGRDRMFGDADADTMMGEEGDDSLEGGNGNDLIDGGNAANTGTAILGDDGDDTVEGQNGDDTLIGGQGRNLLYGGPGRDQVTAVNRNPEFDLDKLDGVIDGAPDFPAYRTVKITIDRDTKELFIQGNSAFQPGLPLTPDPVVKGTRTTLDSIETAYITNIDPTNRNNLDIEIGSWNEIGMTTIEGAAGDDTIVGAGNADYIDGGDGDDELYGDSVGGSGNDTINGGEGNDFISGRSGRDLLFGGAPTTQVGATNDDTIYGGGGDDTIFATYHDGDVSTDPLTGRIDVGGSPLLDQFLGLGMDIPPIGLPILTSGGDDVIQGNNSLYGDAGADLIFGGTEPDTIQGGTQDDLIFSGVELTGAVGADDMTGGDLADGNSGNDTIYGSQGTSPVGKDTLRGGSGNDLIIGGDEASPGDLIVAGNGDDTVDAGDGDDTVRGNAGADSIVGGTGDDCLRGNAGDDTIEGGEGEDAISGNGGDDVLLGEDDSDDLTGGPGADSLDGGNGPDTLHGGRGADTLSSFDGSNDEVDGGPDVDLFYADFSATFDVGLFTFAGGGAGDPGKFTTPATKDSLNRIENAFIRNNDATGNMIDASDDAGGGTDIWKGKTTLVGGDGADCLFGGDGQDVIIGGDGADTITGADEDDLLFGGWVALLVNDAAEVANDPLTPDPDTELALSDINIPTEITGEYIRVEFGTATLVTERDSTNRELVISETEKANDLHILFLDSVSHAVEAAVHFVGGYNGLTGVMATTVQPHDGAYSADTGANSIKGQGGDDVVIGGELGDFLWGGSTSNDLLLGGEGNDVMRGNNGNDTLFGMEGNDRLLGGSESDSLVGGEGGDTLQGDGADDTLNGGPGADSIDGGSHGALGDLLLEMANVHAAFNTTGNTAANGELTFGHVVDGFGFGEDTLVGEAANNSSIERAYIEGGDDDNDFDASALTSPITPISVTLVGLGGDDTLVGGDAADSLVGGGGADILEGGAGNDNIDAGNDPDTIDGGAGDDSIDAGRGADSVQAGDGADTVYGNHDNDTIIGDSTSGGAGADVLAGGPGADYVTGGSIDLDVNGVPEGDKDGIGDLLYGDGRVIFDHTTSAPDGNDTLDGQSGGDGLSGGDGNDVLVGGPDTNVDGRTDSWDILVGGSGNDTLFGGLDNDYLVGQGGADVMDGETGVDTIQGGDSNDLIVPDGADSLFGQAFPNATVGVNTFLNRILFQPENGDTFLADNDGDGWLDWLDQI